METVTGGKRLFKVTADVDNVDASFFVTDEFKSLDGLTQCDLLQDIYGMAVTAYNRALNEWRAELHERAHIVQREMDKRLEQLKE